MILVIPKQFVSIWQDIMIVSVQSIGKVMEKLTVGTQTNRNVKTSPKHVVIRNTFNASLITLTYPVTAILDMCGIRKRKYAEMWTNVWKTGTLVIKGQVDVSIMMVLMNVNARKDLKEQMECVLVSHDVLLFVAKQLFLLFLVATALFFE